MFRRRCLGGKKTPSVSFGVESQTLQIGEESTIPVLIKHISGSVVYSASPSSIITIMDGGNYGVHVKALKIGNTTLSASIAGYMASCSVSVIGIPRYEMALDHRPIITTPGYPFYITGRIFKGTEGDPLDLTTIRVYCMNRNQSVGWVYCRADGSFTIKCYEGSLAVGENLVLVVTSGLEQQLSAGIIIYLNE